MPKKRRTPKQRAASRRNLEKARAARKSLTPMGKTVLLVHGTSQKKANKIVAEQRYRPHKHSPNLTFFAPYSRRKTAKGYGRHLIGIKVPRKVIQPDWTGERHAVMVDVKDLAGRKIKRYTGK